MKKSLILLYLLFIFSALYAKERIAIFTYYKYANFDYNSYLDEHISEFDKYEIIRKRLYKYESIDNFISTYNSIGVKRFIIFGKEFNRYLDQGFTNMDILILSSEKLNTNYSNVYFSYEYLFEIFSKVIDLKMEKTALIKDSKDVRMHEKLEALFKHIDDKGIITIDNMQHNNDEILFIPFADFKNRSNKTEFISINPKFIKSKNLRFLIYPNFSLAIGRFLKGRLKKKEISIDINTLNKKYFDLDTLYILNRFIYKIKKSYRKIN